ncbi:MAG: hypothetical protein KDB79_12195, partial [Acidobacteria bacterium]|nr:hypothetical protein [Acidobacteriota bacterium]
FIVAGLISTFWFFTPGEAEHKDILAGAFLEGTPEFENYTKEIIISTNTDRLMQSMTGLGTITMHMSSSIYNKGDRVISGLQVLASVVDTDGKVVREKKFMMVPNTQRETLEPGQSISVTVNIGGFSTEDDRANVRWKVTAIKLAGKD